MSPTARRITVASFSVQDLPGSALAILGAGCALVLAGLCSAYVGDQRTRAVADARATAVMLTTAVEQLTEGNRGYTGGLGQPITLLVRHLPDLDQKLEEMAVSNSKPVIIGEQR